jgi:hypothetical protein
MKATASASALRCAPNPKEQLTVVYMAATPGDIRTYYRTLVRNLVLQSIVD